MEPCDICIFKFLLSWFIKNLLSYCLNIQSSLLLPEYVHITELVHISAEVDATIVMVIFILFSVSKCLFLTLKNLPPGFIVCCSCLKDSR